MQGTVPQLQYQSRQKEHISDIFFGLWWHTTSFLWIFHKQDHHNKKQLSSNWSGKCWQNRPLRKISTHIHTCHWTICFGNFPHTKFSPNYAILIPLPQNSCTKTFMFSSLQSPTSSTLRWLLGLHHQTSKLLLSKPAQKSSLDKNVWKNYRPVSNLPFLSKIFENVIHSTYILHKLLAHLHENNPWNPFQSACPAGHSIETALLRVVSDLLNAMDKDKIYVLLLLDLSAAFGTVDHQILLSRLENVFGIRSIALLWFRSYLLDRNQCVVVNSSASSSSPLMFGIPQGSVLGPVLLVL